MCLTVCDSAIYLTIYTLRQVVVIIRFYCLVLGASFITTGPNNLEYWEVAPQLKTIFFSLSSIPKSYIESDHFMFGLVVLPISANYSL